MLVVACGGRCAPHAGVARLAIIAVSCGPLKGLLVPLFAALLGAVGGDVGWRLPVTAWGRLPASRGGAKHDRIIAGGATWLLEDAPEEVTMSALPWQGWRRAWGSSRRPCRHSRASDDKSVVGDGASLIVDGIAMGSAGRSRPEPSWGLSQTNASKHTLLVVHRRWHESPPVGGTSCPPHRW
jgi:hypothetical protein